MSSVYGALTLQPAVDGGYFVRDEPPGGLAPHMLFAGTPEQCLSYISRNILQHPSDPDQGDR